MNFGNIAAGMSAAYPGYVQGRSNLADMDTREAQAQNALMQIAALGARGNAFKALFGDMQAPPMAPNPGQSSAPMSSPSPGGMQSQAPVPFAGPSGAPASGPTGQGAPQPSVGPGGGPVNQSGPTGPQDQGASAGMQQPLSWQAIVSKLNETNPGMRPEVLAAAVDQFVPMMNQQSKLEWQMLSMQLKQEHSAELQAERLHSQEQRSNDRLTQQSALADERNQRMRDQLDQRLAAMEARQRELQEARRVLDEQRGERSDRQLNQREEGRNQRNENTLNTRRDVANEGNQTRLELDQQRGERSDRQFTERQDRQDNRQQIGVQSREQTAAATREQRDRLAAQRAGTPTATDKRIAIDAQRYDVASQTIDHAVDKMVQLSLANRSATGVVGRAVRFGEFIDAIRQKEGDYAADAVVNDMRMLRAMIPRLLSGKGLTGKDERANLNALMDWTSPGSAQVLAANRLLDVQRVIQSLNPRKATEGLRPGQSTGGTGLKPMTPELRTNMQRAIDAGHNPDDVKKRLREKGYDPDGAAP